MLTQEGYSANGATGSAKEYFDQQFNGKYEFSFDVTDVVTVSQKRSYYGKNDSENNDENPHIMVIEACRLADEQGVDFSKYDQDGDGEVDNVFVFFAGLDEASGASKDHIWSHAWYIKDGAGEELKLDGVFINRYACASEREGAKYEDTPIMTGIGTFCHEYSHTLGLPDFYDADYDQGGYAASLWLSTSLMDGGNANNDGNTPPYLNSIEREILGLSEPIVIDKAGDYELPPINQGVYYRINTSTEDEYFLIEYRDKKGWDKYIGGQGVLIYHVDKSKNDAGYSYHDKKNITAYDRWSSQVEINALSGRQCADLIEADKRKDSFISYGDNTYWTLMQSLQGIFFPYGDVNSLTPLTTPGLKGWGSTTVEYSITDIAIADGKATFSTIGFSSESIPTPTKISKEIHQDCVILRFNSNMPFSGNARVVYSAADQKAETVIVPSYKEGSWAVELDRLKPMTSYTLQITFVYDGVSGETVTTTFMTKKQEEGALPYIYLGDASRNENGSFKKGSIIPLRVYNSAEAVSVKWLFDGSAVKRDEDLRFKLTKSGVLQAFVTWEDGSEDVIIKKIRISDK
jgi:M6 family metalloprotease-like protein